VRGRLIQHKKEAYWFYRFLSVVYDRWVNPLFWTPAMRTAALDGARLGARDLVTLDVGAGTGFTTEGIVAHVDAERVTMLDQSPHQLARSRAKPPLAGCTRVQGDAEALPFADAAFDRYVSAGSVEYWPEPARAVAEAFRVLRPGGVALLVGPLPPGNRAARALADLWMLFPPEADYRRWFEDAGFEDVDVRYVAPHWHGGGRAAYGIAIAGRRPAEAAPSANPAGVGATATGAGAERLDEPMSAGRRARFALRFVAGSAAGAVFVPVALVAGARARLRARR
jgi:MPBQ/MSBQ methyltransferase